MTPSPGPRVGTSTMLAGAPVPPAPERWTTAALAWIDIDTNANAQT